MNPPDRAALAAMIDHTLLRPEATAADVAQLCAEAAELGVGAVCVSPSRVPLAPGVLADSIELAVVVGFPSGAHTTATKAFEAAEAVSRGGATEIDVVIDLGLAKAGAWRAVTEELSAVRRAVPGSVLKAILESGALSADELHQACAAAERAGCDFVKTSSGFHPGGGATLEAVRTMREAVGDRLGIKASGGIRTAEVALAMVDAGATRLGTSSSAAILSGLG